MATDRETMEQFISDLRERVDSMTREIKVLLGFDCNLGSNDQISAALYGGIIKETVNQPIH